MISVCMATYNGEKYIREQLESILKQIGCNDEIIISDDGSKDATQQVIDLSYKQNTQAFLVKLAQSAHKAAVNGDSGKLSGFTNKAYYLYKNMGEKRACYLLAQLLRLTDSEGNQQFIKGLLEESVAMKIIEEVA